MPTKPFGELLMKVKISTWRTTICRLIGAEREMERLQKFVLADSERIGILENEKQELATKILRQARAQQAMFNAARQTGQNDVLNLIARWGVCRPLEGYNGKQMAEALRKVITPTIAPYTENKGITQASGKRRLMMRKDQTHQFGTAPLRAWYASPIRPSA